MGLSCIHHVSTEGYIVELHKPLPWPSIESCEVGAASAIIQMAIGVAQ